MIYAVYAIAILFRRRSVPFSIGRHMIITIASNLRTIIENQETEATGTTQFLFFIIINAAGLFSLFILVKL